MQLTCPQGEVGWPHPWYKIMPKIIVPSELAGRKPLTSAQGWAAAPNSLLHTAVLPRAPPNQHLQQQQLLFTSLPASFCCILGSLPHKAAQQTPDSPPHPLFKARALITAPGTDQNLSWANPIHLCRHPVKRGLQLIRVIPYETLQTGCTTSPHLLLTRYLEAT